MFKPLLRAAAPVLLLLTAPLAAQQAPMQAGVRIGAQPGPPITPADLLRHIEILASDGFQGRAPGTEGERLTINYIAEQWRRRGLEPAGESGSWFQPVRIVERRPERYQARWTARGAAVEMPAGDIVVMGKEARETVTDAPVVFAGHGVRLPERGVDQLAGANIEGAVVLILLQGPSVPGFPSVAERMRTVNAAGAIAVIAIVGDDVPWEAVSGTIGRGTTRLDETSVPRITGVMPMAAAQRLVAAAGGDMGRLLNDQPGSSFRAVTLAARVSIEATTSVVRYTSNNVVGRLRGGGATGQSLLLLGHWDHFGTCRPEGEGDRICNGAVDNASGIATLIEVAGRLSAGPRPARDMLFLATTSEEVGLLGAEYFASHPVVPLDSIVAAVNLDTVALAPAGEPVAILNRDIPGLAALVETTATAMGRRMDNAREADSMVERQDGFALARHGVAAFMVGGSFASMARLNAFLSGRYHGPDDEADGTIELNGAAEDADLLVALSRRLADPQVWRRPLGSDDE